MGDLKQVIVMRKDLGMRKGKMIAQGAHASVDVVLNHGHRSEVRKWAKESQSKIVVSVDSEEALNEIYRKAFAAYLPCAVITDAGRTEFAGVPTRTCCAIGPGPADEIDKITGNLPLL